MEAKPSVNLDLLILKEGKILLGLVSEQWREGKTEVWGLPGKDLLYKESMKKAAERMMQEEFSCGVKEASVTGVFENFAYGNHYIGIGMRVIPNGELRLAPSEDFERWEWWPVTMLPQDMFGSAREQIEHINH